MISECNKLMLILIYKNSISTYDMLYRKKSMFFILWRINISVVKLILIGKWLA